MDLGGIDLRYVIEVANGVFAIISGWLSFFLFYHLAKIGSQRRIWAQGGWRRLPLSMQLAVSLLVISTGMFLTRVIVWFAGYSGHGDVSVRATDTFIFVGGMVLALCGFLCALRVVTAPMVGPWPWRGALIMSIVYMAWSGFRMLA